MISIRGPVSRCQRAAVAAAALLLASCGPSTPAMTGDSVRGAAAAGGPVVQGTVRNAAGAGVVGAEVFVGVRRVADPGVLGACERFGDPGSTGLLELVRTTTGPGGAFRQAIATDDVDAAPNCVMAFAQTVGSDEAGGEQVIARSGIRGVPLPEGIARLDLTLQPEPEPTGRHARFRTHHQRWAEVARASVPGFAGFVLEGCTLVVHLTDPPRQRDAARRFVLEEVGGRRFSDGREPCPEPPPIEFRRVEHDFDRLVRWSQRAGVLLSLEGAVFHGISEARNRIEVGFLDEAGRRRAERTLATLDVPRGVVVIEAPVAPVLPHER